MIYLFSTNKKQINVVQSHGMIFVIIYCKNIANKRYSIQISWFQKKHIHLMSKL
jgi:hypothetical protein